MTTGVKSARRAKRSPRLCADACRRSGSGDTSMAEKVLDFADIDAGVEKERRRDGPQPRLG